MHHPVGLFQLVFQQGSCTIGLGNRSIKVVRSFVLAILYPLLLFIEDGFMVQAKAGDTAIVHYTGKLEDGSVFDSSVGGEPLQFLLGSGQVIPGFEDAILGMAPGESKTEVIPCDQAYGDWAEDMVLQVERQAMPEDMPVEVGQQLELHHPSGEVVAVTVTAMDDDKITLDANHPLAGQDLTFELQLVALL